MKVLVTGATSLIGRGLVGRLLERGDGVTVLQRHPSGLAAKEHLGDVADAAAVAAAMKGVDAVVHLAARVSAVGSREDFEAANVEGTRNVVERARERGVQRLVHVSTPSVAHSGRSLVGAPAGAADPHRARGHYARSKARAELIALGANSSELSVVAIRPHLVWGPGDRQLVGRIVARAKAGRLAIVGSGCSLVDTTYIDNAVDALVAALDHAQAAAGSALVVSNGQPRPVREMLNRIVMAAGLDVPRLRLPFQVARIGGLAAERIWSGLGRQDDPPMTGVLAEQLGTAHWFDQRATRAALGWEPAVSLDEGFELLRAWFDAGGFAAPSA